MTQLTTTRPTGGGPIIDDETIDVYAGIYVLKKMDLRPEDGGMTFGLTLAGELTPLEPVLHRLHADGLVKMNRKEQWELTKDGLAYLARLIDEAEDLMEELDELEPDEAVAALRASHRDPLRARFLWGWYDGEFDDLVEFQRTRGVTPVQPLWAYYLTDDELYAELAKDLSE